MNPRGSNHTTPLTPESLPAIEPLDDRRLLSAATPAAPPRIEAIAAVPAPRPTIKTLSVTPNSVRQGEEITLVAKGPAAPKGDALAAVEFYRDVDGNGRFDVATDVWIASDRSARRGWQAAFSTAHLPGGMYAFFARARDAAGRFSKPASASATVIAPLALVGSYRGTISFKGDGQDTLLITVEHQTSGHVTGSLEQVGRGLSFDLAGDLGDGNTFTLTFSGDAGSGTAKGTVSADGRRMTGTFTSHIGRKMYSGTFNVKRFRVADR